MENIKELKESINALYGKYKHKNNTLNKSETDEVAKLLVKLTNDVDTTPDTIAKELARFSADVCRAYFDKVLTNTSLDASIIDNLLFSLKNTDDGTKSQHYIQKYINAIVIIINKNPNIISEYKSLKPILMIILKSLDKDDKDQKKYKNKFIALINDTKAAIYTLTYTPDNEKLIKCLGRLTVKFYSDIAPKHIDLVKSWAETNRFTLPKAKNDNSATNSEAESTQKSTSTFDKSSENTQVTPTASKNSEINSVEKSALEKKAEEKSVENTDAKNDTSPEKIADTPKANNVSPVSKSTAPKPVQTNGPAQTTRSIEKALDDTSKEIISAVRSAITPLESLIIQLKDDTKRAANNSAVIESLRNQVSTLESKVEELNTIISNKNKELEAKNMEITENNVKIEELKDKLGNAYSMVEHVNSQDTAKLKAELSQDLHFSYDMWSEYKDAECSEDNFESLKIIIDELFRKIERKGINVKE